LRGSGGVPSASNPTYSFALPGAAPLGVPNFFIDSFQIPPFLLPIYQAAGIEYDVPWQVLAAINEIETDYGRNLSVSSAGAVGWMQFLPSTWKRYAVAATGNGIADPYNPVDAIFTAARYLAAAGASKNISQAVFAYNHAEWYVQSVLLRAKLIGGLPSQFIGALTGLVEGHFPVAAAAKYADDYVESLATRRVKGSNAAEVFESDPSQKGVAIYAKQGSPVIAVNDGKIVGIGQNAQWGRYVQLQDANGNVYTYANLGSVPSEYPVPKLVKVTAAQIAKELSSKAPTPGVGGSTIAGSGSAPAPTTAATAGSQSASASAPATAGSQAAKAVPTSKQAAVKVKAAPLSLPVAAQAPSTQISAPQVKERLFAYPSRAASYAAGGSQQLETATQEIENFQNYFSDVLHLGKNQYTLKPLKTGATVVAGTILGRIGPNTTTRASHLEFMIRPAGKDSPYIDPKPILDGWKLLEATAVYRAAGVNPFLGKNPSIGQILLESKEQLQNQVLEDPHVQIYACGQRDIAAGLVDRRILAVIEFLSASGLDPTVSGLVCGAEQGAADGVDPEGKTGDSVDISKINGIPIQGHQGPGSITDIAIRRLLTLQGTFQPSEIISTMSYKDQPNTLALPDHTNRIQITFTPEFGNNKKLANQVENILKPNQWVQLIQRIGELPEPVVPITPSKYAIKVGN
jgi:murein DD-endopeptidase MepM/ murein hydrolase activator NlpD